MRRSDQLWDVYMRAFPGSPAEIAAVIDLRKYASDLEDANDRANQDTERWRQLEADLASEPSEHEVTNRDLDRESA